MNISNKIVTTNDVSTVNNYIKNNNLRKEYGNRSDSLWYKEDCYVKSVSYTHLTLPTKA